MYCSPEAPKVKNGNSIREQYMDDIVSNFAHFANLLKNRYRL